MWNEILDFVLNDKFGYQGANKIKNNIIALASARIQHFLGGSRSEAVLAAVVTDVPGWVDVELDGTLLVGLTIRARVEVRTMDAATSVTPRVRNITDSSDAGVGVACTATNADYSGANQKQSIALTIASGIKTYRLQVTPQNATNPVFGIGYIEILATS